MNKIIQDNVLKATTALELERQIVGVKFLFSKEEFKQAQGRAVIQMAQYCVMVKSAASGHSIKIPGNLFKCTASARALGFAKCNSEYTSGKSYKNYGFYKDIATSQNAIAKINLCTHEPYGIQIMPLDQFVNEPDVVIIITTPYNIMRILQGYSYTYGIKSDFKMSGNQAICAECTSYPFQSNDINVSMLCSGTRYASVWKEHELAVGMPFNKFPIVVDGLIKTIDSIETDMKKELISKKVQTYGLEQKISFSYGTGYFMQ